ncbi:MAG TPA: polysaccharide biosynthesis protein, partial [Hyalangium sp.]|nr:polysaccharide biosynthesis protein [Hyalangium sp.]
LGVSLAAPAIVREGLWIQALVGVVLFSGLFLLREWLPGRVSLVAELRTIITLIRARRAGVTPRESSP